MNANSPSLSHIASRLESAFVLACQRPPRAKVLKNGSTSLTQKNTFAKLTLFRRGSPGRIDLAVTASIDFGVVNGVVSGDVVAVDAVVVAEDVDEREIGQTTVELVRSPTVLMRSSLSSKVWSPQQKKSLFSKSQMRLERRPRMVRRNGCVFASEFPIDLSADNLGQESMSPHLHSSSLAEACG